jgi:hypothetical protein
VTAVVSIQNPSTYTRWIGLESIVALMPTSFIPGISAAPIENSPPGIQTMPFGAGFGAAVLFSIVGWNSPSLASDASVPASKTTGIAVLIGDRRTTSSRRTRVAISGRRLLARCGLR